MDVTRTASETVDALKSQPLSLALIVINVLFLATGAWIVHESGTAAAADREARMAMLTQIMTLCDGGRTSP